MDNEYFILKSDNASKFILNYYIGPKQSFNLDFDNCSNLINFHIPPNYCLKSSFIGRPSQHFFNENAMTRNDFGRNSLFFNEALMKGNGLPVSLTDH
jgi:hypothetical protein